MHKTLAWTRFSRVKNAWKNDENCFMCHSYTLDGFADECQKSCKIYPKRAPILRQMNTKTHEPRCRNGKKHMSSTDMRKCMETRLFLSFPVLLCSSSGCQNRTKSSKNWYEFHRKYMHPDVAMVEYWFRTSMYQTSIPNRFGPRPGNTLNGIEKIQGILSSKSSGSMQK